MPFNLKCQPMKIKSKKTAFENQKRFLVARLGFEPRQTESESVVLPLHNSAMLIAATSIITHRAKMSTLLLKNIRIIF